jgi:hypothetical protein
VKSTVTVRHVCSYCNAQLRPPTVEQHTGELIQLCNGNPVSHGICTECLEKHYPDTHPADDREGRSDGASANQSLDNPSGESAVRTPPALPEGASKESE